MEHSYPPVDLDGISAPQHGGPGLRIGVRTDAQVPRWYSFDVQWLRPFERFVHLRDLKDNPALADMRVVQNGQQLSIQPGLVAGRPCQMMGTFSPDGAMRRSRLS